MRLLKWIVAVGLGLAVIGFIAFRSGGPGVTEVSVEDVVNRNSQLQPFPPGRPWEAGPMGENPLTQGVFATPPPPMQVVAASVDNGLAVSSDLTESPTRLFWLANDQVLVRWGTGLHLISTASGTITPVTGYDDAQAASPDGTWVIYAADRRGFGWMVNARTGERFTFPNPPNVTRWLTDSLAVYGHDQEDGYGFIDMADGSSSWLGTRMLSAVRLETGAICYATPYGEFVICHPSMAAQPLTLTGYRSGIAPQAGIPVPDPSGSRVAFVDRLGKKPRKAVGLAGTAYATKPMPPNPWVDTLSVYNPTAGLVKRYPMPEAAFVEQILWSPDGARLALRHREGNTANGSLGIGSTFQVLDLAAGDWSYAGRAAQGDLTLERVLPEGLLVRRGEQLLELLPGGETRPWQPGKQPVPEWLPDTGPVSGIGRDYFFVNGQVLELHAATGAVFTWQLGDAKVAMASASPDRRWAGVLTTDNQLLLLRRD